jgi:hypothetical protein
LVPQNPAIPSRPKSEPDQDANAADVSGDQYYNADDVSEVSPYDKLDAYVNTKDKEDWDRVYTGMKPQ